MKQDIKIYFRLLAYLKPYWGYAILVLIGFALSASTEVSIAKLLEFIINAIQTQNIHQTSLFPFLVVLLIFVRGIGSFLGDYYSAVISRHLIFKIRQQVFGKLLKLPSNYYLKNSSGQITSKILYNIDLLISVDILREIFENKNFIFKKRDTRLRNLPRCGLFVESLKYFIFSLFHTLIFYSFFYYIISFIYLLSMKP